MTEQEKQQIFAVVGQEFLERFEPGVTETVLTTFETLGVDGVRLYLSGLFSVALTASPSAADDSSQS